MPSLEPQFTINAPIDTVWAYMSDMRNIGAGVPDCTVDVIDDETSDWVIKAKMGPLSKKIKMTSKVTARDDVAHHVEFAGTGELVDMSGEVNMWEAGAGTEVKVSLDLEGRGAVANILNGIINTQVDSYKNYFVESVTAALN